MQKRAYWIPAAFGSVATVIAGIAFLGCIPATPAEESEAVEARLQQLEDREAIRQLLMDYGKLLDQRDFVAFSRLFSEVEGEWIGGLGKAKGSQAICRLMENTIGKDTKKTGTSNYHLFTNEMIQVGKDRASAITKWMFVVQAKTGRPQPFYLGHYEDTFVRESGQWKFLRRVVYGDIPADDPMAAR